MGLTACKAADVEIQNKTKGKVSADLQRERLTYPALPWAVLKTSTTSSNYRGIASLISQSFPCQVSFSTTVLMNMLETSLLADCGFPEEAPSQAL